MTFPESYSVYRNTEFPHILALKYPDYDSVQNAVDTADMQQYD